MQAMTWGWGSSSRGARPDPAFCPFSARPGRRVEVERKVLPAADMLQPEGRETPTLLTAFPFPQWMG